MYKILRSIFFLLSPEKAHYTTMRLFKIASKFPFVPPMLEFTAEPKKVDGLTFKNSVGLAA